MSKDQIEPIGTIPGTLDELSATFKARDAEVIQAVNTNHRLMLAKFDEGENRFNRLEQNLSENTRETKRIAGSVETLADDSKELIEAAQAAKGAIKVLNWIGSLAKPLGYVAILAGAIVSAWTAIKGGISPK